jgi:TusA-related sulfurtransferase
MAGEFVSTGEALKLISSCSCNKKDIMSFISDVDTAFELIDPNQGNKLYKFMLTFISGEMRTAIAHRNLDN